MSRTRVSAGSTLRDRAGSRSSWLVFGLVGVALAGAGVALPGSEFRTLLVAWGGTALFVAVFLRLVAGNGVPATVASDVYTAMAANQREHADPRGRYVPGAEGVRLDPGLVPVGERLLAGVDAPDATDRPDRRAAVLVDALVNDLELARSATATVDDEDGTVRVRVSGSRVATDHLVDHPVRSVVGVGLAVALDRPVATAATVDGDELVVTCRWESDGAARAA